MLACTASPTPSPTPPLCNQYVYKIYICATRPQSTYFTVSGQSYFSRLPKYWPPIPLSAARRVCPPPQQRRGGTHSPGGEGDGGSTFWKTREIRLPSYSKICTLWFILWLFPSSFWIRCRLKMRSLPRLLWIRQRSADRTSELFVEKRKSNRVVQLLRFFHSGMLYWTSLCLEHEYLSCCQSRNTEFAMRHRVLVVCFVPKEKTLGIT